jgi:hypothetical protein
MKDNTKTLDPALVAVQMQEWPDSVLLTDIEMLTLLNSAYPDYLKGESAAIRAEETRNIDRAVAKIERLHKEVEQMRAVWARNAFLCRTQDPQGFFYACGKREDGSYRYIGFRFGPEPHQYMSGFMGMNYTPNQPQGMAA